jgi:hypothetical protein
METLEDRRNRLQRFAKLPRLISNGARRPTAAVIERGLGKLARRINRRGEFVRLQVQIGAESRSMTWTISITEGVMSVSRGGIQKSDVKFVVGVQDGWRMLRGEISPAEVYLMGRLLVVGDCNLAKRLYRQVAGHGSKDIQ